LTLVENMIFSTEEQRTVIKFLVARGEKATDIHHQLKEVCGDSCLSDGRVRDWVRQFKAGRVSCEDEYRCGRPTTSTSDENIASVQEHVMSDRRLTLQELSDLSGISSTAVGRILSDYLNMTKVSARWVPRMLDAEKKQNRITTSQAMLTRHFANQNNFLTSIITVDETWIPLYNPETKQQSKQWKHVYSPPPKKFRTAASAEKVLYAIFWDSDGVILAHPVPKGQTITGQYYKELIELQLLPAVEQSRPRMCNSNFRLHHDNAPPHTSRVVTEFLIEKRIETVQHPPYSPDLAPSDFWLFPNMKNSLRGTRYSSRSALGSAIFQWTKHTPKESFAGAYQDWMKRCQRCIEKEGDYVEK